MKKIILMCLVSLTINLVCAQSNYEKGMQKGFQLLESDKHMEAVAQFERIAQAENDNWIPPYHAARILIFYSYDVKDLEKRKSILKKAKSNINLAHKISRDNAEILTLEGLLYTGYVVMDPDTYGMSYSSKIIALHNKALSMDAQNPRARLNLAQYEMQMAKFFGKDLTGFCQTFKELIVKFENQKSDIPFSPSEGLERTKNMLTNCDD